MQGIAKDFFGLFIQTEVINTILLTASQSRFHFLYSSLSVLPSQRLAGFSARGALGCKALHVEGEGETNKSALVLQKQAHRCMPVKRSVRLLWLPLTPCSSLHHSTTPPKREALRRATSISCRFLTLPFPLLPSSFLSFPLPCDRSKLLRWNNDHPGWNWSKGGRLHHLPLPQRRLVEAGAVLAAGVPQRPVVVIERLHPGWWERSGKALPTAPFCMIDRAGAQFLSNLRQHSIEEMLSQASHKYKFSHWEEDGTCLLAVSTFQF